MVAPPLRVITALMLMLAACDDQDTPICLTDDFAGIDTARWQLLNPGSGAVTANGRLAITLPPASDTIEGLRGLARYDLADGFVVFEIVRYGEPSANTHSDVMVGIDDSNYVSVG